MALLLAAPETISVNPSVPATTMKELAALVKANPGKYNYASPGYGSSPHLASERLFKHSLGLDVVHVPFQGGPPAVTSTVAGHTQILHLTLPIVAPLVRDGKLRLLAVADTTRAAEFPDVPTLDEAGIPNHEVGFWDGIMVPRGTPDDIIKLRHRQISEIIALPEVRDRLAALGYTLVNGSRTGVRRASAERVGQMEGDRPRGQDQNRMIRSKLDLGNRPEGACHGKRIRVRQ